MGTFRGMGATRSRYPRKSVHSTLTRWRIVYRLQAVYSMGQVRVQILAHDSYLVLSLWNLGINLKNLTNYQTLAGCSLETFILPHLVLVNFEHTHARIEHDEEKRYRKVEV